MNHEHYLSVLKYGVEGGKSIKGSQIVKIMTKDQQTEEAPYF